MKTVELTEIPPCDVCGEPAAYDTPTRLGPWGYLCKTCFPTYGYGSSGFKIVEKKEVKIDGGSDDNQS